MDDKYNVTLPALPLGGTQLFLKTIVGEGKITPLPTNLPDRRARQIGFVGVLDRPHGQRELLHIEFRSTPDRSAALRMLGYYSDLLLWMERLRERLGDLSEEITQTLVYVGDMPWQPEAKIDDPYLKFRFDFIDIKKPENRETLVSGDLRDAIVAALAVDGTKPDVTRAILSRIACGSEIERTDAAAELIALSKLRGVGQIIAQLYMARSIARSDPDESDFDD
jgi:hypothetical protein